MTNVGGVTSSPWARSLVSQPTQHKVDRHDNASRRVMKTCNELRATACVPGDERGWDGYRKEMESHRASPATNQLLQGISMRLILSLFLAGVAFAPATITAREDKPMMPNLDAKEWKKQKSGLEIWDAKEGKGDAVKPGAKVKVHYTGWLTDGKIFDSSVVRKEPIEFPLSGVIKGWQEGIPGMKVGGVRRLKIPAELAYGDKQVGPIPPKSTLVFEVEMLATESLPEFPDLKAKEWKKLDNGLEVWDVEEGERRGRQGRLAGHRPLHRLADQRQAVRFQLWQARRSPLVSMRSSRAGAWVSRG